MAQLKANNADLSNLSPQNSRAGRGSARVSARSGPSTRSRSFQRDVSGSGAMSKAIGEGLQSFKRATENIIQQEAMDRTVQIRKDDAMLKRQAERLALSDPKALREALLTGDSTKLGIEEVEGGILNRSAFVETAKLMMGEVAGKDIAASPEYLEVLATSTNPRADSQAYLKEQMKGMDPLTKAAATRKFADVTEQGIIARRFQIVEQEVKDQLNIENHLWDISLDRSPQAWDERLGRMLTIANIMGPDFAKDVIVDAEKRLIDKAAAGDPQSQYLIDMHQMDVHSGLSITERHKEYVKDAAVAAAKAIPAVNNPQQKILHQKAKLAIQERRFKDADTLMDAAERDHGTLSNEYIQIRQALETARGAAFDIEGMLVAYGPNGDPAAYSEGDRKKTDMHFLGSYEQMKAQMGDDTAAWYAGYIGNRDMHEDARNQLGEWLNGKPEQAQKAMDILSGLGDRGEEVIANEYKNLFSFVSLLGIEKGQETFQDYTAEGRDFTQAEAITKGRKWNKATLADNLKTVVNAGNEMWGGSAGDDTILPLPDDLDFEETSIEAQNMAEEILAELSFALPGAPDEAILKRATEIYSKRIGKELRDGDMWIVPSRAGHAGSAGEANTRTRNITGKYLNEQADYMRSEAWLELQGRGTTPGSAMAGVGLDAVENQRMREAIIAGTDPSLGRALIFNDTIENDAATDAGHGVLPHFILPNGLEGPLDFISGQWEWMSPAQAGSELYMGWAEPDGEQGKPPQGYPSDYVQRQVPNTREGLLVGPRGNWHTNKWGRTEFRIIGENPTLTAQKRVDSIDVQETFSGQQGQDPRSRGLGAASYLKGGRKAMKDYYSTKGMDNKATSSFFGINPANAGEIDEWQALAREASQKRGEHILSGRRTPEARAYREKYNDFLTIAEGPSTLFAYDDQVGALRLVPGAKLKFAGSKKTIARGFNLEAGEWDRLAEEIGLTKDQAAEVLNSERDITRPQADHLDDIIADETAKAVYKRYDLPGPPRPDHFYIARMSLWHHGVRETPSMDGAYLVGDWDKVAHEIMFRSEKNIHHHLIHGVRHRRVKETRMMLGDKVLEMSPGPKRDTLMGSDVHTH